MNSATPIVLADQEGELLWFNRDLLILKATSKQTNGAFLLFEEQSQRGKATPLHVHPNEDEAFYVLDGEVRMHVDGAEHAGGPGSFVAIPRGVPHAFTVTSETARVLTLLTPGSPAAEAFFRDAGEEAPEHKLPPPGPPDIKRIQAAAERHGSVKLLGPPPFPLPDDVPGASSAAGG